MCIFGYTIINKHKLKKIRDEIDDIETLIYDHAVMLDDAGDGSNNRNKQQTKKHWLQFQLNIDTIRVLLHKYIK